MRSFRNLWYFIVVAIAGGLCTSVSVPGTFAAEPVPVEKTFNQEPFAYRVESDEAQAGYHILRLTFPSPVKTESAANNTVPADYYLPDGASAASRRPAVLVLHILNGDFTLERLLCTSLACRGIPAVMIKLPYYGERALPGGRAELAKRPDLFATALPQGIQDARRMLDVLQSRPEINPDKLGISGISLGGIVSATAAGSDPRIQRTVLLLAGGDLLGIIGHAREVRLIREFLEQQTPAERTKYEAAIREVDPLTRAAALRDRAQAGRVLMLNAQEDDVITPACTKKLAAALGIEERVVWFEGLGHYTAIAALPQTFRRTVDFFAEDLPRDVKPPTTATPAAGSPGQIVAAIAGDAVAMVTKEPDAGHCHLIDLSATVTDKNNKKYEGTLRLVRGAAGRFRIEFKIPQVGEGMWGQDQGPWMASATHVYRGENGSVELTNPLQFADQRQLAKFRTVAAGFAGLLLLPGVLDQSLDVQSDNDGERQGVKIGLKDKKHAGDVIRLTLNSDHKPTAATFDIGGTRGELKVRGWQLNTVAPQELFEPPSGRTEQKVAATDLYRIYAATFNFLMELAP